MAATDPTSTIVPVAIPAYLVPLLCLFAAHGEAAYPVGGCVRDSLRGVEPHDWDIAVTTPPEETEALCRSAGYRVVPTGIAHGTLTVLAPLSADPADRTGAYAPVECTTCRTEGGYTDSRHPDRVSFTGRIEDDPSRRDFTVNAMAFVISPQNSPCRNRAATVAQPCNEYAKIAYIDRNTPADAPAGTEAAAPAATTPCAVAPAISALSAPAVLDLFGGQADLTAGIIRCVGDPDTRFEEDALRILRAVRFAARLGFAIEPATAAAIVRRRDGLARISRERVADELIKILCSPAPERGVAMLYALGLLPYVLPRGASPAFGGAETPTAPAPYPPTASMSSPVNAFSLCSTTDAIINPIAEPATDATMNLTTEPATHSATVLVTDPTAIPPTYPRLSALPAEPAIRLATLMWGLAPADLEANLASLKLSNAVRHAVTALVSVCGALIVPTSSEARRQRHRLGDLAVPAWEIRRAHTPPDTPETADIDRLVAFIRASEAAGEPVRLADLAVNGRDLLAIGIAPGPGLQSLLGDLLALVWDDPAANTRDTLLAAARRRTDASETAF